jgi:hypothetical protein
VFLDKADVLESDGAEVVENADDFDDNFDVGDREVEVDGER